MPLLVRGTYKFNDYHGMLDHDAIQHMQYEKTNRMQIYLVLITQIISLNLLHKLKLNLLFQVIIQLSYIKHILQHVLGTNKIVLFLPTDFVRNDSYVYAGVKLITGKIFILMLIGISAHGSVMIQKTNVTLFCKYWTPKLYGHS